MNAEDEEPKAGDGALSNDDVKTTEGDDVAKRRLGQCPDPLKLSCTLNVLKHLHVVAEAIEARFGDKSADKLYFISGVQGRISRPSWTRDYTYFLAAVDQVRRHLKTFCVQSAIDELFATALNIYNRYENRRRMGVELIVLCALANKRLSGFQVPDKYQSPLFVLEMLVSCRHRFQKPEKSYFWSRQSEELLMATLSRCRHLKTLRLAMANDALLRAISVHCPQLEELEIQFALDVSEEALFALAGKSVAEKDQGNPK